MNSLSISEQLLYSTVRILGYSSDNSTKTVGTGFIYNIFLDENSCCPLLITNKHVIQNMYNCKLIFHLKKSDGSPSLETFGFTITDNFAANCTLHPDPAVDLAACSLVNIINTSNELGKPIYFKGFDKSLFPSKDDSSSFSAIENIVMIGYPNGIYDEVNNLPIVRKGITATPFWIDFNGKKNFLADISCYPGSSGSPVLVLEEGVTKDRYGNISIGKNRLKLLGINSSVFLNTLTGDVYVQDTAQLKAVVSSPNNLAIIIKSEELLAFDTIVKDKAQQKS